ncbi:MAG TPA: glycosyltransferase family A protein [Candidatus Solibacter sp.]|nr:glycosyltransferase family A protein [Candidatus Solibacter sp.]
MNEQLLPRYVLITPARNEEAFIEKTIESVVHQTYRPVKWVIINDGSTDGMASRIEPYVAKYDWIELVNLPVRRERNFAAKVNAFNKGQEQVKGLDYAIIGNLDSDVSLDPDHFEFLMNRFREDPQLGVAGTVFREEGGYNSGTDSLEGQFYVSGQCQMFRRECFKEIGGYFANKAGGIDWIAVTTARMMGWKTRSFREKSFFHQRHLGTAERSAFAASFSYGEKDYYLGGHPLWELFRVVFRMTKRPYLVEGVALGLGYGWAALRRLKRPISKELVAFHRREQMRKLRAILKRVFTLQPIDKFQLLTH